MPLWFTSATPPRYFWLSDEEAVPSGGLLIRSLQDEELSADEDWLLPQEISADEGRARLEQAGQDSLLQLGDALRQLWQVGRQAVIAETGQDPSAAFRAAAAEARETLLQVEVEAGPPLETLSQTLATETSTLLDVFSRLGAELAATLDSEEGRAALGILGQHLTTLAEGSLRPAAGEE